MQLIFNELSLEDIPEDISQGEKNIKQFILAYNESVKKKHAFSRQIITCVDLNLIAIAKDYYTAQWRNNPKTDRDLANRFRGMCDRQFITDINDDEFEFNCCKGNGKGLLAAYEGNDTAISIATHNLWNDFILKVNVYSLVEDTNLEVEVYNLTNYTQLSIYSKQLAERKLSEVVAYETGNELLKDISILFPSLIFHKNAINQIKNDVEPQHIPIICKRLLELEEFFANWGGAELKESDFKSKMTPESKATLQMFKKEHTFSFEGKDVIVSYHLRYTENIPGRVYFHPNKEVLKGLVCSVTTKLPTVSDRNAK